MSRYLKLQRELMKRNEKGYNEEEQGNHLIYQIADKYNLRSIAVLYFTGEDRHFEVFANRGLTRNFTTNLYSSNDGEIISTGVIEDFHLIGGVIA